MALPRKRRLKKEFIEKVLKRGRVITGRNISLKYFYIPGQASAFGFVISSKVAKSAVVRNKLKRRGRAIVSKFIPFVREGNLAFVFFHEGSMKLKFKDLENEMAGLFKRAGILLK